MSVLVVLIPPRPRLAAGSAAATPAPAPDEFVWVLSDDRLSIAREGRGAASALPRAESLIAVLAPTDVSWHRIDCPRASPARMAAALTGVLEEMVIDDVEGLHLALAPGARPGEPTWVAATDRNWLQQALARLEQGGRAVERVTPSMWPDTPPTLHVHESLATDGRLQLTLSHAHPEGVGHWPLGPTPGALGASAGSGGLRALLPQPLPPDWRCSATPAAASAAGQWFGPDSPVQIQSATEQALQATRSLWNLRQFSLVAAHRGLARLRDGWRRVSRDRAWRPLRWGLATLVVVQIVGLNLAAWQQRKTLAAKQTQMVALLQAAHPQVRAVLDAPVQMQRETDALRASAGRAGDSDLEPMLQAAASAWPQPQPVGQFSYEPGKLTLATPGWSEDQINGFRAALAPAGWRVEADGGRLTLQRAPAGAPAGARPRS
ncbi:type II secretion system protein GspL [Rivibacter subsaxonicus]|uniref:General secretion pathway protein L n=1 Tax=Rivibacter subsaxonicus TaxID=457575 RepID=A0A4Q7VZQ3_9BURK|nr:type II secretion system protein GspL [Rivibacter subsaxonicus]RZU02048.1 general secretion pathway protein L [Rivibacter subsaxonicus]